MDRLSERLRAAAETLRAWRPVAEKDCLEAADELERLRGVICTAIAGDWPMPRAEIFRADGQHSKHDRCPHGSWMYDGCENCLSDWLESQIEPTVGNADES